MLEHHVYLVFEILTGLMEMLTVYLYQNGVFRPKDRKPWQKALAYGLFGLSLFYGGLFGVNMIVMPFVTLPGLIILSFYAYQANWYSHIFAAVFFLIVVLLDEMAVTAFHSALLGVDSIHLDDPDMVRAMGILTAVMMNLISVKLITTVLEKHRGVPPVRVREIFPLLLFQAVMTLFVTAAFISAYELYGRLTFGVFFQVIGVIILNLTVFGYFDLRLSAYEMKHQKAIAERQLNNHMQYYEAIQNWQESLRSLDHDIRNHIKVMQDMLDHDRGKEAKHYLAALKSTLPEKTDFFFTPHPVVNAILSDCLQRARQRGVQAAFDVDIPDDLAIDHLDLTVLLGNTVNNALEALAGMPAGEVRRLSLLLKQKPHILFYEITNSFDPAQSEKKPSHKRDRGYGLRNAAAVARKYGGDLDITQSGGAFTLSTKLKCKYLS